MKKRFALVLLIICAVCACTFALTACDEECTHQWKDATCLQPKTCILCNVTEGDVDSSAHTFNRQAEEARYLVSVGNCLTKAVYNYSCACGEKGVETFESRENGAHDYGEWQSNEDGSHIRFCKNDENHFEAGICSGGTATCTQRAVCDTCGGNYGKLGSHSFTEKNIDDKYLCKEATCVSLAKYYFSCVCGISIPETFEVGDYADHEYGDWQPNGFDSHIRVCKNDETHFEADICGGGTATCTQRAVCDTCGGEYGNYEQHIYDQKVMDDRYLYIVATCQHPSEYFYSCVCGACGWESFETEIYKEHNWSEWKTANDGRHYRECIDYVGRYHDEYEACSGGRADCANRAICDVCKAEYGEVDKSVHSLTYRVEDAKYLVEGSQINCLTRPQYYYTCACGEGISTKSYNGHIILRHTVVEDEFEPAYFGKNGFTKGSHCELCGFVFAEREEITPLSENYYNRNVYSGKTDGKTSTFMYSLMLGDDNAFVLSVTKRVYTSDTEFTKTEEQFTGSISYVGNYYLNSYKLEVEGVAKPLFVVFNRTNFEFVTEDGKEWVKDIYDRPVGITELPVVPRNGNSIYGYNDLANNVNGSAMQSLYRRLYAVCEQFVDSDIDVEVNDEKYVLDTINLTNLNLSIEEAVAVWKVFYVENPRYYWLSNTFHALGDDMIFCIDGEYANASYRYECDMAIEDMVHASSLLLKEEMFEVEKALVLHDFIVTYMNYAYEDDGVTPESDIWAHNMIGAAKNRLGVCEAYAKSYLYLCLLNNIDCIVVTGDTVDGVGHEWNLVCIDGAWYGVDCTWDDNGDDENVLRNCFGMSILSTDSSRIADLPVGEGIDYLYQLPICNINSLLPVRLYENGEYLGLYHSIDDAFGVMTNANGVYDIELLPYPKRNFLTYTLNEYTIFSTQTPAVKMINIHSNEYDYGNGWGGRQLIYIMSHLYLNGDMTLIGGGLHGQQSYIDGVFDSVGSLNLQSYTLTLSGSGEIGLFLPIYGSMDDVSKSSIVINEGAKGNFSILEVHTVINMSYRAKFGGGTHVAHYIGGDVEFSSSRTMDIVIDLFTVPKEVGYRLTLWLKTSRMEGDKQLSVHIGKLVDEYSNRPVEIYRRFGKPEDFVLLTIGEIVCSGIEFDLVGEVTSGYFDENDNFVGTTTTYDPADITDPLVTLLDMSGLDEYLVRYGNNYMDIRTDDYEFNAAGELVLKQKQEQTA